MAKDPKNWPDGDQGDVDDLSAFFRDLDTGGEPVASATAPSGPEADDDPEELSAILDELVEELQRDTQLPPVVAEPQVAAPIAERPPAELPAADPPAGASDFTMPLDDDGEGAEFAWTSELPNSSFDAPWPDPSAPDTLLEETASEPQPAQEAQSGLPQPISEARPESTEDFQVETPWRADVPEPPGLDLAALPETAGDDEDPDSEDELVDVIRGEKPARALSNPELGDSGMAGTLEEFAASLLGGDGVPAPSIEEPSAVEAGAVGVAESAPTEPEDPPAALWTPRVGEQEAPLVGDEAATLAAPDDFLGQLVDAIDGYLEEVPFEAPAPMAPTELRRREAGRDYIVFSLAGERFAIPVHQVTELDEVPRYTFVPNVPEFVLGVANLRGDIISVLDLRRMLGLGYSVDETPSRMLVVRVGDDELVSGLVVDAVHGIAAIPQSDVEPAPELEEEGALRLEGIAGVGESQVGVIDLPGVFEVEEVRRLAEV